MAPEASVGMSEERGMYAIVTIIRPLAYRGASVLWTELYFCVPLLLLHVRAERDADRNSERWSGDLERVLEECWVRNLRKRVSEKYGT